jgi:lipopolysaccharide export system permease protein
MQTLPIEPNLFRQDPATGNVFYVGSVDADGKTMHNVMIYEAGRTTPFQKIIAAKVASVDGASLVLSHAAISQFKANGEYDGGSTVRSLTVGLPLAEKADEFLSSANNDPYTMDSKRLREDIKFRKMTGQGGADLAKREITLAEKLSLPFAAFISVLIALTLAVRFGKKGRALGIALSILVLFVYYVLGAMSSAFGRNGTIDPYVAAWIPNAIFAAVGGSLVILEDR